MIYVLTNLKGGVGKTTTAINLSYGLAKTGRKVLLIDMDGQCSATHSLVDEIDQDKTICEALINPKITKDCIVKTAYNFDLIPSKFYMFKLESLTVQNSDDPYHKRLYKVIQNIKDQYDDIVVDNNPRLEAWATNSIYAAKDTGLVIIPIKLDRYALEGFNDVVEKIERIKENYEININWKVLITMKNRTVLDKDIIAQLNNTLGKNHIYETTIRNQNKPVTESTYDKTVLIENKKAGVAEDYRNFISEVIGDNYE